VIDLNKKLCANCKEIKHSSNFYKNTKLKNGLHSYCKDCSREIRKTHNRTKKGLITRMYLHQLENSKLRKHNKPSYSKEEFIIWIESNNDFDTLYNNWVSSEFNKNLAPSVDRIDDYRGYSFDNIRLTTWGDNRNKYFSSVRNRINKKALVGVEKYDKTGVFLNEYDSIKDANLDTNINMSDISQCCQSRRKTAGGYVWKFKNDNDEQRKD
jgi:hypothetical protein